MLPLHHLLGITGFYQGIRDSHGVATHSGWSMLFAAQKVHIQLSVSVRDSYVVKSHRIMTSYHHGEIGFA